MALIETTRLTIRCFKQTDYDGLHMMLTDADIMQFTSFKEPQSQERIQELLVEWIQEGKDSLGIWAAEDTTSGNLIGWVMLKPIVGETPELGYMIIKSFWGQGYATELGKGILNYAFNTLNIPLVVAETSPENKASIQVLKRIGMQLVERTPRFYGSFCFEAQKKPSPV